MASEISKSFTVPMSEYIDYEELKAAAMEHIGADAPEIAEFQEMDAADGDSLPF